ncbi:MAG: hypothetical protein GY784_08050 [Gammaproteobacteria bacterium]|nr:hypothetical protein [Gammaproteobacteria bacterium]
MATEKKKYTLGTALARLSSEKLTGTLICVNEQHLQGRIFVKAGRVLMARCHNHEGRDAIEVIQKYPLTTLKFHNNKNLVLLEAEEQQSTTTTKVKEVRASKENQGIKTDSRLLPDALSMAQLQNDKFEEPLTAEIREILTEELAEQMGPMADVLVSELPSGINLSAAITTLSHDIDDLDLTLALVEALNVRI